MSWANVRNGIVAAIEGLTPANTTRGRRKFKHITREDLDTVGRDRAFEVLMASPPTRVGQATTTQERWLTSATIDIYYLDSKNKQADHNRIAQDCQQIQNELIVKGNHHADVEGIRAIGSGFFGTGLVQDDDGNYILSIDIDLHHL